jgi:hypothetical protein
MKSANQLYKDYKKQGGTASFADWLTEHKSKMFNADGDQPAITKEFPVDRKLNDSTQQILNDIHQAGGLKNNLDNTTVFGIPKTAFYIAGGLLVIAIGWKVYDTFKNRK